MKRWVGLGPCGAKAWEKQRFDVLGSTWESETSFSVVFRLPVCSRLAWEQEWGCLWRFVQEQAFRKGG